MDFLDKLVLPQSAEHIQLLHYVLMVILSLSIPFWGLLLSGNIVSLYFIKKENQTGIKAYNIKIAKDLINIITVNKSTGFVLGILPIFTTLIILAQVLHNAQAIPVVFLILALIFSIAAIISVYTYKYALNYNAIFNSIDERNINDKEISKELISTQKNVMSLIFKSGRMGILFLIITTYLLITGISTSADPQSWSKNIFYTLFSWQVITKYIEFILSSAALTGAAILFAFFYWEREKENFEINYANYVKQKAVKLTFIPAIVLPLFIFINAFSLPSDALSGGVFAYVVFALVLLFFVYHFLYAMVRDSDFRTGGILFFFMLFSFLALVIKDQLAMGNANQLQTSILSAKYDNYLKSLKGDEGTKAVNGKEIYEVHCATCHKFDVKLIGPPYKQTLPKYEGNKNELIKFILNPTKKNPDYPPMPNPGLKPNEAKAVAEYILGEYKKH